MAGLISIITSVLGISLTLGTDTYTLGGIALGVLMIGVGIGFFKRVKGGR